MKLFEMATCANLPPVDEALKKDILQSERTCEMHKTLFEKVEALHVLETGGELLEVSSLSSSLCVMSWNMQRCLYPEQSAELLRPHAPDVIVLSEMDCGMARTHQRNTTRALADCLGMCYAFGLEFFELGLGNDLERRLAADDHNEKGWHGNAILFSVPPVAQTLIRLDASGLWFCPDDGLSNSSVSKQPRIGGRCAVAAILPTQAGDVCVASVHLESLDDPAIRLAQMERLIAALDAFAPSLPTIIAGDLNTAFTPEDGTALQEPLFRAAERHGYSWENNAQGTTTRSSLLTYKPRPPCKLDWFCTRGFSCHGAHILPAVNDIGSALSDHEIIMGRFERA
ncbi:endonuclease/exonuclease/phosphatase family protein [uncultured Cohaesibacter sp.]|uniref:endonuclease/exonuclease/phosphatase family protein n=1 Tax=uncultured Cohaesibacter sp. TaxID=1002546 RepID=UPI002AAADDD3|nr:endonuclease/exonuclease/phosphatase family protein [uncultured Cohaesibacter sp.]